jgi:hypothetical protein
MFNDLRAFNVQHLPPTNTLGRIVQVYVRINTAGKRVEPEERAFADLVAVDRNLEEALDAVATSAHGKSHASADKKLRDIRLKRRRETQFGLALMVRTIAVLIAYHRDDRLTSSRVSLSSIDAEELAAEGMKDKLPLLVKNATSILKTIAEVLQSELGCDDFRMLQARQRCCL